MDEREEQLNQLLEVLHRGFVQIRSLALDCGQQQIADLADALEIVPVVMQGKAGDMALIDFVLENYRSKYPAGSHYVVSPHLDSPVLQ